MLNECLGEIGVDADSIARLSAALCEAPAAPVDVSDPNPGGPVIEQNATPLASGSPPCPPKPAPAAVAAGTGSKAAARGATKYDKWDSLDPDALSDEEDDLEDSVMENAMYEVVVEGMKVRRKPSMSGEVIDNKKKGSSVLCDARRADGWVRIKKRCRWKHDNVKGWMLVDGAKLGLGVLLKRVNEAPPPKPASAAPPPKPAPSAPSFVPLTAEQVKATAAASAAASVGGRGGGAPGGGKKALDYSKWDAIEKEISETMHADRKPPEPKREWDEPAEEKKSEGEARAEAVGKGFDMAEHQRERVKHLEMMKSMGKGSSHLADTELKNEQIMRDAKQQGNQGNLVFNEDGQMVLKSEDEMGGKAEKYTWGQGDTEVTVKVRCPAGTKSKQVSLKATSKNLKLSVCGESICDGALNAPIVADETTFSLEDDKADQAGGRLLTVTMTKLHATKAREHWPCVIKGEAVIDTSSFGTPIVTVNPNDPEALKAALTNLD